MGDNEKTNKFGFSLSDIPNMFKRFLFNLVRRIRNFN